ncbi:MAG TPA: alkaline phosphatase family protein [Patescibacteria group bacterium]|nr:alkaline phosphatase family protein [Patescibacteria group bacterium]
MPNKLVVIGLDCLTPQFLYGDWLKEMPNFRRLLGGGLWGNLVSIVPPITIPAWSCMMTSYDPGMLGFYGFRNRKSRAYEELYVVNSGAVKAKTVWNHLSRNRLRSILVGIPQTYPPKPLNGVMVSGFLTPGRDSTFTYPAELALDIDGFSGGEYIIDVKDFRTEEKAALLEQIYTMTERRFRLFRHLLTSEDYDFAMMVEMGPDRIHHAFWRFYDRDHRLYEKGNEFEDVIRRYYLYLDEEVGRVLECLDGDTSVMIVSDHGAKTMHGGICINEFLMNEGVLALKESPSEPTPLRPSMIDWKKTKVWGEGGYYARIFFNVSGREPQGVIQPSELESFRSRLKAKLEALTDDKGNNIGTRVFIPEEIYRECRNIPPDLIVYLGDLDWRSVGSVGYGGRIHVFENDTGPDDANHAQEGVFAWYNRGEKKAGDGRGAEEAAAGGETLPAGGETLPAGAGRYSIYDIAPSILDFFSIEVPDDMTGKVL